MGETECDEVVLIPNTVMSEDILKGFENSEELIRVRHGFRLAIIRYLRGASPAASAAAAAVVEWPLKRQFAIAEVICLTFGTSSDQTDRSDFFEEDTL
ncbi:hypothetical protein C3L33_03273, partial [Rhododendron williamsianum]